RGWRAVRCHPRPLESNGTSPSAQVLPSSVHAGFCFLRGARQSQCAPPALRKITMSIGLVGRKCGMTRVYTDAGDSVAVTVVEVLPNRVTQVKTAERDGYRAVQVTY